MFMKKVILAVLDGVGVRDEEFGNAFKLANTSNISNLLKKYPHTLLDACGNAVGLPQGQMGNSEVGHLTIGAGRVVLMALERINASIADGTFFNNVSFLKAIDHAKSCNSKLHIFGMLSDGGVHSHINHIFNLLKLAHENDCSKVYLHLFLDGRDTLPNVALKYLHQLDLYIKDLGVGKIATIQGRYYGMDREGMWDVTKISYDAVVRGIGKKADSFEEMINECYAKKIFDEFIPPYIFDEEGLVDENDSLIVANFRPDRLLQLFWALSDNNFPHFSIKSFYNTLLVTMMPVDERIKCINAFASNHVRKTLGEVLENVGYRSLRIAEVSKYPHVTHFFDGDEDIDYLNTDKIKIPRHDVKTYDLDPKMSSYEVTNKIIELIDNYDFILVNYANGDMVGHTGNMNASIKAIEAVDDNIGLLYKTAVSKNFLLIVTADHGNVEEMLDKDGNVLTSHSLNPVLFIVCDEDKNLKEGTLADIAPTVLDILDIDIPKEMTGVSLIR